MKDLRQKLLVTSVLAGLAMGALALRGCGSEPNQTAAATTDDTSPSAKPRDLLNRLWFDKLPEKRTDEVSIALFFSGGIGLFDTGSAYRSTFELFEFERKAADLDFVLLHDNKRANVKYTVTACEDKPPFDLCLVLEGNPRGPKKLYGFAYDDDEAAKVPWSRELRDAARAHAKMR